MHNGQHTHTRIKKKKQTTIDSKHDAFAFAAQELVENTLSISYKCVISMCDNMAAFQMRRNLRDKIVQPPQLPKSNRFRRTPRDKIVQPPRPPKSNRIRRTPRDQNCGTTTTHNCLREWSHQKRNTHSFSTLYVRKDAWPGDE